MTIHLEDKYDEIKWIGNGSFCEVFKATEKNTGTKVALKQLDPFLLDYDYSKGVMPAEIQKEIDLLHIVCEKNQIVTLFDSGKFLYENKEHYYLVFEKLHTDLTNILTKTQIGSDLDKVKRLFYQLCKGLKECHELFVLHRDIKPDNLLVDETHEILKIADFGLGRTFGFPLTEYTPNIGAVMYRAPEILLQSQYYNSPVDIWSAGCVLAEMATGKALFEKERARKNDSSESTEQMKAIVRKLGSPIDFGSPVQLLWPAARSMHGWRMEFGEIPPQNWEDEFKGHLGSDGIDLLKKMLTYDQDKRISAEEAMNHHFFDGLDKSSY